MFAEIIEGKSEEFVLSNATLIKAYELNILDQELLGLDQAEQIISSLLSEIPEGVILKIYLKSEVSRGETGNHSRNEALQRIGYIKNRIFVIFEKYPDMDLSLFRLKTIKPFQVHIPNQLQPRPLSKIELENIYPKLNSEIFHQFQTIDTSFEKLSLIRLTKQSEFGIDLQILSQIKDTLPLPYTIYCSVQKVPATLAEGLLRRRSKQNSLGSDMKEARKFSEAQSDLEDISLNGLKLFRFEWVCLLNRTDESELRLDRETTVRSLQGLGEVSLESVGALKSLMSLYPGARPHFTLLEKDSVLNCYLPLLTSGECPIKASTASDLVSHRADESISKINIFNPKYESFSWCIFGRPGTGKSVLTNAITRSLLHDPNIKIIKIDVGGSHSRETKLLGGIEKTLTLNEPTGLNPFNVLSELGSTKEAIQILTSFLEVLILEEGETKLSKTMKSEIETSLFEYSNSVKHNFSLNSFFEFAQKFPRRNLLSRWVGNGVYGNAFATGEKLSESETRELDTECKEATGSTAAAAIGADAEARSAGSWTGNTASASPLRDSALLSSLTDLPSSSLIYYNFSKISQALDPDYAQGGLAAVMAQFNLEMLKKNQHKKRIVFIADETPFFIKKCFNFFNLSIANVRKEGHGFITVAQKSAHTVVDGDTGILDNSPNKIYFSYDGDEEEFISRNQLSLNTLDKIKALKRKQGEYSECLFKDGLGERTLRVRLSPIEYWSYTSKDEDRQKFSELQKACPSLSVEEVIKCLAR